MFHLATFKSKSFYIGLGQIVLGGGLLYLGQTELGGTLVATGLSTIGLADRATKVLASLDKVHAALEQK